MMINYSNLFVWKKPLLKLLKSPEMFLYRSNLVPVASNINDFS